MTHDTHAGHEHTHAHRADCGHVAVVHGDHTDYLHDGHAHREHDGHWDECSPDAHVAHASHEHEHGEGCGHEAVSHDDHTDYVHDGHRHWWHAGHGHCARLFGWVERGEPHLDLPVQAVGLVVARCVGSRWAQCSSQ